MPIPVSQALEDQGQVAADKAADLRRPGRFLVSSMLAGAFIGVAAVLLLAVAGPLLVASSPYTKLVEGLVFGVGLTLAVFAGAELSTGNMMTAVQGAIVRRITAADAGALIVGSFVGNLVGSVAFAWLVHGSGVITSGGAPGHTAPALALLASLVKAKAAESGAALFFRGVLCNFLVCLAVWMAARTRSEGAKLTVIFWCLLAFVGSGFEHVVANMTYYTLGMFEHIPGANAAAFGRNLLLVGLGNLVGGGLLVGAAYAFVGRGPRTKTAGESADSETPATVSA
ncbi:formate/nitrite transporter family protein [Streptomyces sp. NPDC046977]|uniref:formate/nitrite transporter family protein n=1 Tax=Streptomyces sp. NPDC046977 TaxID=3154703 RepID=UPI0033C9B9FC